MRIFDIETLMFFYILIRMKIFIGNVFNSKSDGY